MSFRFRYFSNSARYQRPFSARKLLSTMRLQSNENSNTYRNLNINTVRSMQLSQDINDNQKIKNAILSKNLENEINPVNLNEILTLMLTYNNYLPDDIKIENEKMNDNDIECSNIISCFQLLIKFLFEKKAENENYNNYLDNNISSLKQETNLSQYNEIIQKNSDKINQLEQKKLKLKSILLNNGKKLPPEMTKKLYICDICPNDNNKFESYRAFHRHYVQNHINPYSFYNSGNNINKNIEYKNDFENKYIENKMNNIFQNAMDKMRKSQSQKKSIFENEKNKGIEKSNILKNAKLAKNNEIKKIKYNKIMERIERMENNRKEFEKMFKINVDNFLNDLKNEIVKLKGN